MGAGEKIKDWFFTDDSDEEEEFEESFEEDTVEPEVKTSKFEMPKYHKTTQAVDALNAKGSNLVLFEPRSFGDSQNIAQHLTSRRAAVVNLHRLQKDQAKRVVDFLSGVIYAIDGDIQKIGPKIFLCTPKNISVAGSIDLDEDETED
ncbi:MAG: cell division protein SepF [Thomasclavelia sp.]|jgi:cell division inhibitor SepF|nr:cell division protein SepF [Thomasclavelia sp.]